MNEDGVYEVCDVFGLRSGSPHGGSRGLNISISCPLAGKNHGDPDDWNLSCSVSISDDEPSLAKCFSFNCAFKGSFYRMLAQAAHWHGNPDNLVEFLKQIEPTERFTMEASLARSFKRFEKAQTAERRPRLPEKDRDVLPEARMERYARSVPQYAVTRGIEIPTCKYWGLGHDKQRGCLVFPIRRYDGKLVGLSGRYYIKDPPSKYHNYGGLNKTRYLYGEHLLKMGEPIIICEGQIDAVITWQHLQIPTVAILGEGFSQNHAKTLAAFEPPYVMIFPDNDPAGHLAAEKLEYGLRGRVPLKIMLPPYDMDPGDLTKEEAEASFARAKPLSGKIRWDEVLS